MDKTIFDYAQEHGCSDIHLISGLPPIVRHVGDLQRLEYHELNADEVNNYLREMLSEEQFRMFSVGNDIDASYVDYKERRYRLNAYHVNKQPAAAIRLLRDKIPNMDELFLPDILKDLATAPRGLVLLTGPTGSGKSTTLAAMIHYINSHSSKHILTLEDPVEYMHYSYKSVINQREIGRDVDSFKTGLRSALREDPDVILVGEMRDYETISLALTAAETGHLVLSTLHTTGAANTIDRIIDSFPSYQQNQVRVQLASVLKGVVSQQLVPTKDKMGRIAVQEILTMTDAVGNLVRENKIVQINTVIQTGLRSGMQSLERGLARLVKEQMISLETAEAYCDDKEQLRRMMLV